MHMNLDHNNFVLDYSKLLRIIPVIFNISISDNVKPKDTMHLTLNPTPHSGPSIINRSDTNPNDNQFSKISFDIIYMLARSFDPVIRSCLG